MAIEVELEVLAAIELALEDDPTATAELELGALVQLEVETA